MGGAAVLLGEDLVMSYVVRGVEWFEYGGFERIDEIFAHAFTGFSIWYKAFSI